MPVEIKILELTNTRFLFHLNSYDCHRLRTGRCSLDYPFLGNEVIKYVHGENSYDYCRNLYLYMKEDQMKPSTISGFSCGHYGFTDGQHRACIAKRTGLTRAVIILTPWKTVCNHCYFKKKDLIYRVKAFLGLTEEFTDDKQMLLTQNTRRYFKWLRHLNRFIKNM